MKLQPNNESTPSRLYQESLLNCPRVQLSILDSNQCSMLHNKKASITQFYRKIPSRYRNNRNRLCMIMSGEKCQYVPMSLFTAFCKKSSGKWGSKISQYLFWREFDKQLRFKKQQETLQRIQTTEVFLHIYFHRRLLSTSAIPNSNTLATV